MLLFIVFIIVDNFIIVEVTLMFWLRSESFHYFFCLKKLLFVEWFLKEKQGLIAMEGLRIFYFLFCFRFVLKIKARKIINYFDIWRRYACKNIWSNIVVCGRIFNQLSIYFKFLNSFPILFNTVSQPFFRIILWNAKSIKDSS